MPDVSIRSATVTRCAPALASTDTQRRPLSLVQSTAKSRAAIWSDSRNQSADPMSLQQTLRLLRGIRVGVAITLSCADMVWISAAIEALKKRWLLVQPQLLDHAVFVLGRLPLRIEFENPVRAFHVRMPVPRVVT